MCIYIYIYTHTHTHTHTHWASQLVLVVKNLLVNAGGITDLGSIPWKKKWQPTPVFLSGESHGQRSLVGYSP